MNSSLEHDEDVRLLIANKQLNPSYTLTDTLKRKLRDNLKKNKEPIIPNSSAYRCQQSELFKASRDHIDNSYQVKRFESENMDPKIDFEEKIKLLESKIDTMQINEINSRGYIQAMIKWDVTLDFLLGKAEITMMYLVFSLFFAMFLDSLYSKLRNII